MTEIEDLVRDREYWIERAKQKDETISVIRAEMERLIGDLEKVSKQRDEAHAEVERLKGKLEKSLKQCVEVLSDRDEAVKQRDEALAEVEKLKEEAHRQFKNAEYLRELSEHYQNLYLKEEERNKSIPPPDMSWSQTMVPATRPEPSRLEIAAMIYAAFAGAQCAKDKVNPTAFVAFKCAGELIAASKEKEAE
jgi:ElaB/YqjD/DUF883 family membrane-anchored ribosome-binding protein